MSKFCANCGNKLDDEADLCVNCGVLVNRKVSNNIKKQLNVFSVVGFVISIIAFCLCFLPFVFVLGIVSLILSIVGLVRAKTLKDGTGLGIGGIIISTISIVVSVFISFILFIVIMLETPEFDMENACIHEFGSRYEAVQYDDDNWYCCLKGVSKSYRNCKKID